MSSVTHITIKQDDEGMRLDRWFKVNYPSLGFGQLQKLLRSGQIRLDGKRVKTNARLETGQDLRLPPGINDKTEAKKKNNKKQYVSREDEAFIRSLIIHEDEAVMVLNKPAGIAVQGGSKTTRHIDGMLGVFGEGEARPKLVHRLDRDTSGVLLIAKTRKAASKLGDVFQTRAARKIYWALTVGVPRPHNGEISAFLKKQADKQGELVKVVKQGEPGAQHSHTLYCLVEQAAQKLAWVALAPTTGRTHQLRVHMAELGTPILNDPKYFNLSEDHHVEGLAQGLHLHAHKIIIPHPLRGTLVISAPLPTHMKQSFKILGLNETDYDPQWEEEL